jgi:SAM-dependent methyltransferase
MAAMSGRVRAGYSGTGPGAITPDGCAVGLYERLPARGEPGIIAGAVPAGASILELGSGAGRVTHPLLALGFTVTAVDESPEMLDRVRGTRTICSPIEDLDLGERFDAVLLGSFLVHAADPRIRQQLLEACCRHVAADGCVLIQRDGEASHENVPLEQELADGLIRVVSAEPDGPGVLSVLIEYVFPDARWTQSFLTRPLTTAEFELALAQAGLTVDAYLTDDRTWVRAVPTAG